MRKNLGMSLIALLVGLSIAAFAVVQIGHILTSSSRNEGSLDAKNQIGVVFETIRLAIGKATGCTANFSGKEIDVTNDGTQTTAFFDPSTFMLSRLTANGSLGDKLIKVGDKIGTFTVTEMSVQLTGNVATTYFANLTIRAENTTQNGPPSVKSLSLVFETVPTSTASLFRITSCAGGKN